MPLNSAVTNDTDIQPSIYHPKSPDLSVSVHIPWNWQWPESQCQMPKGGAGAAPPPPPFLLLCFWFSLFLVQYLSLNLGHTPPPFFSEPLCISLSSAIFHYLHYCTECTGQLL